MEIDLKTIISSNKDCNLLGRLQVSNLLVRKLNKRVNELEEENGELKRINELF